MKNTNAGKAIFLLCMIFAITATLNSCTWNTKKVDTVNFGVFQGPTGIGAAYLINQSENGKSANKYDITVAANATDLVSKITSGTLDIAAMPTNVAANLYNKTDGDIQIIALNTLGVLYVLENGESVNSIEDLRGKTIYATGQGAVPEYTINFLLEKNGLNVGKDVTVEYLDTSELSSKMISGDINLCMLPVPYATAVLSKNTDIRQAVDITEEWNKIVGGSGNIVTGCVVARRSFIEENKETVDKFIREYGESVNYVLTNENAPQVVVECGIVADEEIAAEAIKKSNIVCITGSNMKPAIDGYYNVLFEANPASIGGKVPDDGIYYEN